MIYCSSYLFYCRRCMFLDTSFRIFIVSCIFYSVCWMFYCSSCCSVHFIFMLKKMQLWCRGWAANLRPESHRFDSLTCPSVVVSLRKTPNPQPSLHSCLLVSPSRCFSRVMGQRQSTNFTIVWLHASMTNKVYLHFLHFTGYFTDDV